MNKEKLHEITYKLYQKILAKFDVQHSTDIPASLTRYLQDFETEVWSYICDVLRENQENGKDNDESIDNEGEVIYFVVDDANEEVETNGLVIAEEPLEDDANNTNFGQENYKPEYENITDTESVSNDDTNSQSIESEATIGTIPTDEWAHHDHQIRSALSNTFISAVKSSNRRNSNVEGETAMSFKSALTNRELYNNLESCNQGVVVVSQEITISTTTPSATETCATFFSEKESKIYVKKRTDNDRHSNKRKRHQSMDECSTEVNKSSQINDGASTSKATRYDKAMQKRQSNLRKTMGYQSEWTNDQDVIKTNRKQVVDKFKNTRGTVTLTDELADKMYQKSFAINRKRYKSVDERTIAVDKSSQTYEKPSTSQASKPHSQPKPRMQIPSKAYAKIIKKQPRMQLAKQAKIEKDLEKLESYASKRKRHESEDERSSKVKQSFQVDEKPSISQALKYEKAMQKRHSNVRKTVACASDLLKREDFVIPIANTNSNMYLKSELYGKMCVLCQRTENFISHHYMTQHPNQESFISRPNPKDADKMRMSFGDFEINNSKIATYCYFCEEDKCMNKPHWSAHFLKHTGEHDKMYYCATCNVTSQVQNAHKTCGKQPINIFTENSKDGSLVAFMCSQCNFVQINRQRMILHLKQQHKCRNFTEGNGYDKITLIPDLSPVRSKLTEFAFAEPSKRYKCTICSKQCQNFTEFENHFDQKHHLRTQYTCFCREEMTLDGLALTGNFISAHLERHSADLYLCIACDGVYYDDKDITNHLLNEHENEEYKYQEIHRGSDGKTIAAETVMTTMVCKVCDELLAESTFAYAIKHTRTVHQSGEIKLSGFLSKKTSDLDGLVRRTKTTLSAGKGCIMNFNA